ncbi:T9SS type B sorting domain-containing protein [Psychroflexus sp. YR1-1]|uniref:T9SS type B sorting domain-containing protein n=1 Tax=Psychroflexus aurantiacus TaxID=2709310 RepID=A0A6B3R0U2_9FLAO|nr:T9SS type B sorting domain-containing protein [Psychroflexus aurantiacus]NEV94206.1 T9SS type B sorting domain-containing protein [Psychroflexus aurantiacus]
MKKKLIAGVVFALASFGSSAQNGLGFCQGNSGDPIFEEDFGEGTENGPALPAGTTSYNFINANNPGDGNYTITNSTSSFGWDLPQDHTPNDLNGKALVVNASYTPGEFFRTTISGLCENNSYEFSAWLINILPASGCEGNGIPVNVRFQIWDETDTTILAEGDTGDINGSSAPAWDQYALTFTSEPGQDSVILKMLNNGAGGCGNDLAIDDIVFRSCGDFTEIVNENGITNLQICEGETVNDLTLQANPDFSVYDTHSYQWQSSPDGENWTSLAGETDNQLIISELNETRFFRTLVAEDPINVNNTSCNSISTTFEVEKIDFIDPVSLGDVFICEGESQSIAVQTDPGIRVNWYDSENAGNLLAEDTFAFTPESNGIFYAEATTVEGNCTNPDRVAIEYAVYETPELRDETLEICEGDQITLSETIENVDYVWSTGETGSSIEVDSAGIYRLDLITADNCVVSKAFVIESISAPQISEISKVDNSLVIETVSEGDFSYSLNGFSYQNQPVFDNLEGGLYTVYVRENSGCGLVTEDFLFIDIPEFFTPNADLRNDTFKIGGDIYYDEFEINIFDRFGKLIAKGNKAPFEWDGTFNGRDLPSDDYWYRIRLNGKVYTGNISLIR